MNIFCTLDLTTTIDGQQTTQKNKLVQVVADNKLHAFAKIRKHYKKLNEQHADNDSHVKYSVENINELEIID